MKYNNIKHKCDKCKKNINGTEIFIVDGKTICEYCMYGNVKPFKIFPIGFVKNKLELDGSDFGVRGENNLSCIELLDSQKPFMFKIEEEEYITVVYYLHKSKEVRSVFNRGLDGKKVGVFASRTPHRLSRVAIQNVKLVKVEGSKLYVDGLDAIDGSPVLDIKMKWSA